MLTWADYGRAVSEVTAGLAELGIGPGQQVGIFSNNRVEWHLADFGTLANGSVTVPLYQTSSAEQVAYVLGHAEARVCFVENHELAAKILEVQGSSCPSSTTSSSSTTTSGSTTRSSCGFDQSARRRRGSAAAESPACSTPGRTRSRPSSWPRSSTRAARPGRPKGR